MEQIATASRTAAGPDSPSLPETYGYNEEKEVVLDDLHDFVPLYSEAILNAEKEYRDSDFFDEDGEVTWDIMGIGAGTPLRVRDGVSMEHVFRLFENSMEEQVSRSRLEVLKDTVEDKKKASAKVAGGATAALAGGYVAAENGDIEALKTFGQGLSNAVDAFEPFASGAALGGVGALLDGGWEIQRDFDPDRYFEDLKEGALEHLYVIDVDYHQRDLGEIDRMVEMHGVEYLEEKNIMSEGQYEMMKRWWEDDSEPVRLLFTVWDPTDDRRIVQHVMNEYFDEYGDPTAVYSRGLY